MNYFGLDIGSSSLKLVELKDDRGKGKVLSIFANSPLSRPVNISAESEEELKELSAVIKEFVSSLSLSTNKVVVALPESQIFTRVVSFPKMNEKELASSMQYEAQQYIPVSLSEVSLDYQIIENAGDSGSQMEVLIIAAPKSLVAKYLHIVQAASLEIVGMETETIAVARSLVADFKTPTTMIVNIGASTTDLSAVSLSSVRFTRSISTGGTAMARAVSQGLGFDLSQADEYKKTYGMDANQLEGKIMQAIKPIFDVITDEIKRSIAFYNSHHKEDKIKRVVVCGGTASLPGAIVYIASSLDLEVELGNPWSRVFIPERFPRQELEESGPSFAVAVGLALKKL